MEIFVSDIYKTLIEWAPLNLAEEWDNSGLQLGDFSQKVNNIFIALDLTDASLEEAISQNTNLIITHHPLIFKALKIIDCSKPNGKIIQKLIKNNIAVISMHTNLDCAINGVSDTLSDVIGLGEREPLINKYGNNNMVGAGRYGKLEKALFFSDIIEILKNKFNIPYLLCVGEPDSKIMNVAVCGGSGSDLWPKVIEKQADLYISSEIKHHIACEARDRNISIVDLGHFNSEYLIVKRIKEILFFKAKENNWNINILENKNEKSPFNFL
jgi:dinuclear metal center YbgI/SA1388 family protein